MKSTSPLKAIGLTIFLGFLCAGHGAEPNAFSVKVTGKGKPLIFIPGLTCPGEVWDEAVQRYAPRFECHVLSLAGFAGSEAVAHDGRLIPNAAAQLAAYIQETDLEKPVIIGHSLGGFIALTLASEHQSIASALVIVDSLPFLPAVYDPNATVDSAKAYAERARQALLSAPPNRQSNLALLRSMISDPNNIQRAARWGRESDAGTVAQASYELATTDLRERVASIDIPTLVLGAWIGYRPYGATRESTEAIFRAQYAKLPSFQLAMTDRGKHFIMWDDPDFFYERTESFLDGMDR